MNEIIIMNEFSVRRAAPADADALKELYLCHLTKNPPPGEQDMSVWRAMLAKFEADRNYNILVGETGGRIVSSVTLVIIENLTHSLRPYALIENVVTHSDCRGRGFATALMERACELAAERGCYKVMLLTGSKRESTLGFYERCGFNRQDKTGFIRWIR